MSIWEASRIKKYVDEAGRTVSLSLFDLAPATWTNITTTPVVIFAASQGEAMICRTCRGSHVREEEAEVPVTQSAPPPVGNDFVERVRNKLILVLLIFDLFSTKGAGIHEGKCIFVIPRPPWGDPTRYRCTLNPTAASL